MNIYIFMDIRVGIKKKILLREKEKWYCSIMREYDRGVIINTCRGFVNLKNNKRYIFWWTLV